MNAQITSSFLESYFGDYISKEARFAIFSIHNRLHTWCPDIKTALKTVDPRRDTYFSVAAYPRGVTKRQKTNTRAIFGVWLDVDCGDRENGKSYFPNVEKAIDWVTDALAGHWSTIVHSGGGLHV